MFIPQATLENQFHSFIFFYNTSCFIPNYGMHLSSLFSRADRQPGRVKGVLASRRTGWAVSCPPSAALLPA